MDTFDAGLYLNKKYGLSFSRVDEKGDSYFTSPDGKEVNLDVNKLLKKDGVPVEKFNVQYNDESQPLDLTPTSLGTAERIKLSFGNPEGQVESLKQKYQDAKQTEDGSIVIKDKNTWHRMDPTSFEMADLAELGPETIKTIGSVIGSGVGAIAGLTTGPAAVGTAFATASIGSGFGNVAGAKLNHRIGEYLGTYKSSETEERDLAFDFVEGLAGPLGGKIVGGALGKLAKIAAGSPEGSKQVLSKVLAFATKTTPEEAEMLVQRAPRIDREITKSLLSEKSEVGAIQDQTRKAIQNMNRFVDGAQPALTKKYGELVEELATEAGPNFKFSVGAVIRDANKELEAVGLGKNTTKNIFELLSNKEAVARIAQGKEGNILTPEAQTKLKTVFKMLNDMSTAPEASGKNAVQASMKLRSTLNQLARDLNTPETPEMVKNIVNQVKQSVSGQISKRYEGSQLYSKFQATTNLYEKYGEAVNLANKLKNAPNGPEQLLKQLSTKVGKNETNKSAVDLLTELQGGRGEAIREIIQVHQTAASYLPKLPTRNLSVFLGVPGTPVGGVTRLPIGSVPPRAAVKFLSKTGPYLDQMVKFTRDNTPETLTKLLNNPVALESMVQMGINSVGDEARLKQELAGTVAEIGGVTNGQQ